MFYNNNSRWDPIRVCARQIKCSWMHLLKILLRCINAVECIKKRHTPRCLHKMLAILLVLKLNLRVLWKVTRKVCYILYSADVKGTDGRVGKIWTLNLIYVHIMKEYIITNIQRKVSSLKWKLCLRQPFQFDIDDDSAFFAKAIIINNQSTCENCGYFIDFNLICNASKGTRDKYHYIWREWYLLYQIGFYNIDLWGAQGGGKWFALHFSFSIHENRKITWTGPILKPHST